MHTPIDIIDPVRKYTWHKVSLNYTFSTCDAIASKITSTVISTVYLNVSSKIFNWHKIDNNSKVAYKAALKELEFNY